MPRPTYLKTLWKEKRLYFWIVIILGLGNVLPAVSSIQLLTPFYVWGMYAVPEPPQDTISVFVLTCNSDSRSFNEPHTFLDFRRMMFTYSILYYNQLRSGTDTLHSTARLQSPLALTLFPPQYRNELRPNEDLFRQYPSWLKRYIAQATGEDIHQLSVYRLNTHFDPAGHVKVFNGEQLFSIP